MRTRAQETGLRAEGIVADRLRAAGWTIVGRNVRVGRAEIDLLAVDPAGPAVVVVEVRWRGRRDFGLPEESISRAKLARLRSAALTLRYGAPTGTDLPRLPIRVDIVALEPDGPPRHYRGV